MSAETCSLFPAALARPANKENGGRGALSIPPCDLCKLLCITHAGGVSSLKVAICRKLF